MSRCFFRKNREKSRKKKTAANFLCFTAAFLFLSSLLKLFQRQRRKLRSAAGRLGGGLGGGLVMARRGCRFETFRRRCRFVVSRRRSRSVTVPRRRRRMAAGPVVIVTSGKGKEYSRCQKDQGGCTEDKFHFYISLGFILSLPSPVAGKGTAPGSPPPEVHDFGQFFPGENCGCHIFSHQLTFVIHARFVTGKLPAHDGSAVAVA